MLPGNAKIVKCPYCGAEKELMTLASGNTFRSETWSDCKQIFPMLPKLSPVQKCIQCGKYCLEEKMEYRMGKNYSFNKGEMPFEDWRKAYNQFLSEGVEAKVMLNMKFWIIQSYNDTYFRKNTDTSKPSEEDTLFFVDIVNSYINEKDWDNTNLLLFKAELFREINQMQRCSEVLNSIIYDDLNEYEKKVYDGINIRMQNGDSIVFRLW